MALFVGRERLGDLGQPFVELRRGPRIERRHRADDAGLALRDHELGIADDEQRRADDRAAGRLASTGGSLDMKASGSFVVSGIWTMAGGSESLERQRRHALGAFDDAVAQARRLVEDVLGVEARRRRSWPA